VGDVAPTHTTGKVAGTLLLSGEYWYHGLIIVGDLHNSINYITECTLDTVDSSSVPSCLIAIAWLRSKLWGWSNPQYGLGARTRTAAVRRHHNLRRHPGHRLMKGIMNHNICTRYCTCWVGRRPARSVHAFHSKQGSISLNRVLHITALYCTCM